MSLLANVTNSQSNSQAGDHGASVSSVGSTTQGGSGIGATQHIEAGEMWDRLSDIHNPNSSSSSRATSAGIPTNDRSGGNDQHPNPSRLRGGAGVGSLGGPSNNDITQDGSSSQGDANRAGGSGGSGHGGNAPDPHKGGEVGGGSGGNIPGAINEGAAALLAKMFTSPVSDPSPSGLNKLPCDTEELVTEKEHEGSTYSPIMWADPLIPFNIKVGTVETGVDRLPAVGCSVNNRITDAEPKLTSVGEMLKAIVEMEGNPSLLRAMMPQKDMKDMSAYISLAEAARRSGFKPMSDVAPLVRLGMLIHCLADAKWMAYSTSCVTNVCVNGYADVENASVSWTPAPNSSSGPQIGVADGTSTLYWRTLSQYCRLINGTAIAADILTYKDGAGVSSVDPNLVKFIPVKMSWRGQSWLGPYILAHTTTKWWNHSVMVKIPVKVHDQKTAANELELHCVPKASTVYIPGSYKFICLVIVDVVEASFPWTEEFYIGHSYKAQYAGNSGFAAVAHKMIGRNTTSPVHRITYNDCYKAWKVMCSNLLTHINPMAIEVQIATLATSRFCGFSVWPDEAKAKKTTSGEEDFENYMREHSIDVENRPESFDEWTELVAEAIKRVNELELKMRAQAAAKASSKIRKGHDLAMDELPFADEPEVTQRDVDIATAHVQVVKSMFDKWNRVQYGVADTTTDVDHISGVTCFDPKTAIKIGDHTIPDWNSDYNSTSTAPDRIKFYTWWRVDPLHRFSQGLVECDDGAKPVLKKFICGEMQYEMSEAIDLVRIMSYAGIFANNDQCSTSITSCADILHRSLGYASLLMGVTELWRLSMGLSLPDHNLISKCSKLVDPQISEIFRTSTMDFLTSSGNTNMTAWTDADFKLSAFVKSSLSVTEDTWLEHWYGGLVPWWFVQAVLLKVEGSVVVRCNQVTGLRLDYDEQWNDEYGYHLVVEKSAPTDLAVLTCSVMYEKKVQRRSAAYFTILTPDKDAHKMGVHWTSWYYNEINDTCKRGLRAGTRVAVPDYDGVVQLNAICNPLSRRYRGYAHPEAFVSNTNRYVGPLDFTIRGGLTWPDPPLEWLKQGLFAIAPHLLRLDAVGAVGAALDHVNKTILDWLSDKVHGKDTFRD
uniref:Capsid n=1 Tax=Culex modestus totivirus TaxID=2805773 RepID=A0A889INV3_9VIRU|nr:MAG: capsid [Culex modestus totivirus]